MPSPRSAVHAALAGLAVAVLAWTIHPAHAAGTDPWSPGAPVANTVGGSVGGGGNAYREPVVLSAQDGVLEVTLVARQGEATLDTVGQPVRNALLFGYRLQRGTASDGSTRADNLYPGPTLNVNPGQTLIVHLANDLRGLTIRDYQDPAFTPAGDAVPLYPAQLVDSPYNLHTHGLHVSPAGNGDNVLLDIPAGEGNTYTYAIPADHPQGLYWYHSHRHMLTTAQVYRGLVGMLVIGRADGGIPAVSQFGLPVRTMALQYNYVFNRAGGGSTLNNAFWPSNVSTLKRATDAELASGRYRPLLTPVGFEKSPPGTTYLTAWWSGPLSVNNNRGIYQYMPSNLQSFVSKDGSVRQPANPSLPESLRDLQYTVNGQFAPVITTKPGQTEIWVLGNFTDAGYLKVSIVNTATGLPTPLAIVGKDGNPTTTVLPAVDNDGTAVLLAPATRVALAVTMPSIGGLRLEMPPYQGANPMALSNPGILYRSNGTSRPPAVTGRITVDPANVSYVDGFFLYPTQTLLTAQPSGGPGTTVPFVPGDSLGAYTSFDDLSAVKPDVTRTLRIGGGFANENASMEDPNAFAYQFDDNQFPNIPLLQPRLNTVEQWNFVNTNNDQHPIHIHVNDFQVVKYVDPVSGETAADFPLGQDNQNTPAPAMDAKGNVTAPGLMSLRTRFKDYIGTYVLHCHRLNHEDNGLMAVINVIPEVTAYAVARTGSGGDPTTVTVYDQARRARLATVTPFRGWSGPVDVAMGDVNGDMVLDLIVGAGPGAPPVVRAFSGAPDASGATFRTVLLDRTVFVSTFRGGVHVASGNIDGTQAGDSVVVSSGPGMRSTVTVLAAGTAGSTRAAFATWHPYGQFSGGTDVAVGPVDASGRQSIVTAPGPGTEPRVRVFSFGLFSPLGGSHAHMSMGNRPMQTDTFLAFDGGFRGGVTVATGWVAGDEGGFARIITGQQTGGGQVAVFSSGSRLDGHPSLYIVPASSMSMTTPFTRSALVTPVPGADGVDVATSANAHSADLVVSARRGSGSVVAVLDVHRPRATADYWTARTLYTVPGRGPVSAVGGR